MKKTRAYRAFQLVYALLALNFIVPAISYIASPATTTASVDRLNRLLGGGTYPADTGHLWHMLAVGNVMTLGFLCLLLLFDLKRFYPALPGLAFLKSFSALYSLAIALSGGPRFFLTVFVLDGVTTAAMIFFAVRAHRSMWPSADDDLPLVAAVVLRGQDRIGDTLARALAVGLVDKVPNRWQIFLGVTRMWHRVLFRSETIGTCADPVRPSLRAKLLRLRWLRFPFLWWERAIAPFDFSGLVSGPERVIRHLLGAHHDQRQFLYDLELLTLHPGAVDELVHRARQIVDGRDPRAEWLRDLCVFEGYHERLLAAAEKLASDGKVLLTAQERADPDLSLSGYLTWCAAQPPSRAAYRLLRRQGR